MFKTKIGEVKLVGKIWDFEDSFWIDDFLTQTEFGNIPGIISADGLLLETEVDMDPEVLFMELGIKLREYLSKQQVDVCFKYQLTFDSRYDLSDDVLGEMEEQELGLGYGSKFHLMDEPSLEEEDGNIITYFELENEISIENLEKVIEECYDNALAKLTKEQAKDSGVLRNENLKEAKIADTIRAKNLNIDIITRIVKG